MSAILNQLGVDSTFFYQVIIFAVIFSILTPLYFNPFLKVFEKRHQKTVADREAAIKLMSDADAKFEEYKAKIAKERSAAKTYLESEMQRAKKEESDILDHARAEAKKITQAAVENISQQQESLKQKLNADIEQFAQAISEKLLSRPVGK